MEHAEAPPRDQLVVHEITAPALVWQGKDRRRRLGADSTPAISSPPECQPLFTIEALGFPPVGREAVDAEQDASTSISDPPTLLCQLHPLDPQPPNLPPPPAYPN